MSERAAPTNDEWADTIRPALVARIAADTGRDPVDVGQRLDETHHARQDDVDPAQIVELLTPTGAVLFGAPALDALARIEGAPANVRAPVLARLAQTLAPAVVQAILAEPSMTAATLPVRL